MADKIIQNPSITTNVFEYDDAGRVSAISGHPLAGEGGGEIVKSDLMWKPTVGADGYVRWTLASSASEPDAAYISGAQGPSGTNGKDGTNGTNGANGISPTFTIAPTAGGTHVVLSGAQGEESFDVLSGAKGADGTAGFSPTVSTTTTATEDRTGTVLTFTYGDAGGQTISYTAWDGKDGTGATVDFLEGTGIQITHVGTTYTIGVSADYALKTDLPDVTDMATQTWVGEQGYLTSVPDSYATKTYANDASANALSQAQTWVGTQGYLTQTALDDYATETYVDTASAEALSQAKTWVEEQSYLPTSGGTVSGQLTISGNNFNNNLHLKRGNNEGFIGLAGNGAITFKNSINGSTSQIEFLTSANKTFDITVKDNNSTPQPVGKLYVMSAHSIADASATSANWANDGMLHIILDS